MLLLNFNSKGDDPGPENLALSYPLGGVLDPTTGWEGVRRSYRNSGR